MTPTPDRAREAVGEKVRTPDVAHLARVHEVVERRECLVEWDRAIVEVQLVEIDEVGLQAA